MIYHKTEARLAICPFFIWTSENIGEFDKTSKENDVNLVHCTHPKNVDEYEGNCRENICPLLKE